MLGYNSGAHATLAALDRSLAIIEFDPTGNILNANENFCRAMGYDLPEIKGRHHSLFVDPNYAKSSEYRDFWIKLAQGSFDTGEYRRLAKGGRDVWIQASYNPVVNRRGKVVRVVKAATDITADKIRNAEYEGRIKAISRAQAVIEFTPDGEIRDANENFLKTLGYSLEEIKGRHHRIFLESSEVDSANYGRFWERLKSGEYVSGEFKRLTKRGQPVFIQATYNPIFDMNGAVVKVVKFATDVTPRVEAVNQIGIGLEQLAKGNLQYRIDIAFIPEFETLRRNFNLSLERFGSTLETIARSMETIENRTNEITGAADEMARRTEQQAASLEETAAALDQIMATVRSTDAGAGQASEKVASARSDAEKSGSVVTRAIAAMGMIETSSREIGQIISVIDEIAFQTNLLALNAGVEAARAGDAGRGFAVVASEVRALAQRSAEAAKEIKGLISNSASHVTEGVALVGETGKALQRIVSEVADISAVVTTIATSAKEQALGLREVNSAVTQMDQATQQNAAMAERVVEIATTASRAVAADVASLNRLITEYGAAADFADAPAPAAAGLRPIARAA